MRRQRKRRAAIRKKPERPDATETPTTEPALREWVSFGPLSDADVALALVLVLALGFKLELSVSFVLSLVPVAVPVPVADSGV